MEPVIVGLLQHCKTSQWSAQPRKMQLTEQIPRTFNNHYIELWGNGAGQSRLGSIVKGRGARTTTTDKLGARLNVPWRPSKPGYTDRFTMTAGDLANLAPSTNYYYFFFTAKLHLNCFNSLISGWVGKAGYGNQLLS